VSGTANEPITVGGMGSAENAGAKVDEGILQERERLIKFIK